MNRWVSIITVLSVMAISGIVAPAQRRLATPEDAVRIADQQWLSVLVAKDVEKSTAFCADDGSLMAPNAPVAKGKEAIRKMLSGFFAIPGFKITWRPDKAEVAKSGELGYTSGVYEMTFDGPGGKPISDVGKYATVWRKQRDDSWKVVLDIFNSDQPPTGAP